MMLSEARGNYGEHGHELQAMSYPRMYTLISANPDLAESEANVLGHVAISHHLDVKGPRGPPF